MSTVELLAKHALKFVNNYLTISHSQARVQVLIQQLQVPGSQVHKGEFSCRHY